MISTAHQTADLIRKIAASFVLQPEGLKLDHAEALDGSVCFAIKGERADDPLLIGKGGSHVAAMRFLVAQLGKAVGKEYVLRLITESSPTIWNEMDSPEPKAAQFADALNLLSDTIENFEIGDFAIEVATDACNVHATVRVKSSTDHDTLVRQRRIVLRTASATKPEQILEMSIVAALGTLWRAIAKRSGVRFSVTVEEAK